MGLLDATSTTAPRFRALRNPGRKSARPLVGTSTPPEPVVLLRDQAAITWSTSAALAGSGTISASPASKVVSIPRRAMASEKVGVGHLSVAHQLQSRNMSRRDNRHLVVPELVPRQRHHAFQQLDGFVG
jgi:hypothetical protein